MLTESNVRKFDSLVLLNYHKQTGEKQRNKGTQNMGSTNNEQAIRDSMADYAERWSRITDKTQTEIFRSVVPKEPEDFTSAFVENHLDGIFTSAKVCLPMRGDYNSNFLYRDSLNETKVPILVTDKFTVLHPLGEPGLDLGLDNPSKVSHMMVITHSDGPITFNEMLPSSSLEIENLEERIKVANLAVKNLKANVPVAECGLANRALELGLEPDVGIRQFMKHVISTFSAEFRQGRPGYILKTRSRSDISGDTDAVGHFIDEVFDKDASIFTCIQPPSENSQFLSHIHVFYLSSFPESMLSSYHDCEVILKVKREGTGYDEGCSLSRTNSTLSRTSTPPIHSLTHS